MPKIKTQLAEKIRELGYHVNERSDGITIFLHGDFVASLDRYSGRFWLGSFSYMIPFEIKELIKVYGDS